MASFSDKADEVVGSAKQAVGDLTGDGELHAEGTVDKTKAQVKQGVDAAADKAEDAVHAVADAASSATESAADKAGEVKEVVADKAEEVKSAVADKAGDVKEELSYAADKAADTAQQLHLDDKRVLIVAAIAGLTLTLLVRRARANRRSRRTTAKRAASVASGVGHLLSR